jgi:hypothetical protein
MAKKATTAPRLTIATVFFSQDMHSNELAATTHSLYPKAALRQFAIKRLLGLERLPAAPIHVLTPAVRKISR